MNACHMRRRIHACHEEEDTCIHLLRDSAEVRGHLVLVGRHLPKPKKKMYQKIVSPSNIGWAPPPCGGLLLKRTNDINKLINIMLILLIISIKLKICHHFSNIIFIHT